MMDRSEAFFSAEEWKALAIVRPREWSQYWKEVPLGVKLVAVSVAMALVAVICVWLAGETDLVVLLLSILVAPYIVLALLFAFAQVVAASARWLLRRIGLLEGWRAVRDHVLAVGKSLLWTGLIISALVAFWPFLSPSPSKTWYALRHNVPVKQIEIEKAPHDCAFLTSPLGAKQCHYEAKVTIMNHASAARGTLLVVTYERVED
jgi:hypothetical protein